MKNKETETKFKSSRGAAHHLIGSTICLAALTLICSSAPAQNLFMSDGYSGISENLGHIYKFTPTGASSAFASGLDGPLAMAFDSAGNLSMAAEGNIYKFTPDGARTTFASGVSSSYLSGLAFDSAGNLFVADGGSGNIYKFTSSGVRTIFAKIPGLVLDQTGFLAFQPSHPSPQPSTPTLIDISARGSVQTGENVLIAGFIVTGSDPKQVIIRALGPTLTRFGVSDVLQDPMLELHNTTSMMTSNDDWQSAANANQIPLNYRPPDSRESAVMTTLQPGAYTAVLSGKNGTTGNGLLEVYSSLPGVTNVSTRGFVGTGDHVLIGGFISSGGNGSLQVIIRALGPTLRQFGVSNALVDPTLALVNSNGQVLASNDNWKNTQ